MGKQLSQNQGAEVFAALANEYDIYGPKRFVDDGCFSDTDVIRYGKLDTLEELVWGEKSQYSFKEVLFPVSETILYFTEEEMKVADGPKRPRLIFLRSCDMHALKRMDQIYLDNGPEDFYYKRMRDNTVFAVMGCSNSFDSCFCVSMETNACDQYDLYLNPEGDGYYMDVQKPELAQLLAPYGNEAQMELAFVKENKETVHIPEKFQENLQQDEMWESYTGRCIACGRCNFVCPTCTCFTMQDVFYKDNPKAGERRRVWASCQVDGYTDMAGGINFRKSHGERMRFKVMHKIKDYKERFGYHMCVGCGRCEDVCPEYISYIGCLKKLEGKGEQ